MAQIVDFIRIYYVVSLKTCFQHTEDTSTDETTCPNATDVYIFTDRCRTNDSNDSND